MGGVGVWGARFGGWADVLGLGGLVLGLRGGDVGRGRDGFGDVVVGIWGRAVWVHGFVGHVLGLGGLCWGMGDWDLGLEGGIRVWVDRFWALSGSWAPDTKISNQSNTTKKEIKATQNTETHKQKPATQHTQTRQDECVPNSHVLARICPYEANPRGQIYLQTNTKNDNESSIINN